MTPRPLTMQFTMDSPFSLNVSPVVAELMDQDRDARIAAYRDPEWRARAAADLEQQPMRPRWETCEVSESERHPELEGRRVDAIAGERGCDPLDVICELAVEEDLATRFRIYIANDDPDSVGGLLTHQQMVLGLSDAGAHVGQLCDAPLPTDLLGTWVRDRGIMPVEHAVRKLTGEPADIFGFVRAATCARAIGPMCASSTRRRCAPGPMTRCATSPPAASDSPPRNPPGSVTSWSTACPSASTASSSPSAPRLRACGPRCTEAPSNDPSMRPLPELTPWTEWFWTSGADDTLRIQGCTDCGTLVHPPVPICPVCRSRSSAPTVVSGRATVVGYTVNQHQWHPDLPPPYVIAVVALAEDRGVRLTTNITGCDIADVDIGIEVQVRFEHLEDVWLPLFEPTGQLYRRAGRHPQAPAAPGAARRRAVRAPGGPLRGGALGTRAPADGRPPLPDR